MRQATFVLMPNLMENDVGKRSYLEFTADWDRAIMIDESISDQLVRRLAPSILKLRQQSSDPITVAIDSAGGSLSALETLLGLLHGPLQNRRYGSTVTVVINRAYSAAANLLAFGDYAVAMAHGRVLFHDVRIGEMEDVTPAKARDIEKSLQDANDRSAQQLATQIVPKLFWVYIDRRHKFDEVGNTYPQILKDCQGALGPLSVPPEGCQFVDIAGFATTLYALLSVDNDHLIHGVMQRLAKWVNLTRLAQGFPTFRQKGSRRPGLLDGARQLHKDLHGKSTSLADYEDEIKLLLTLLIAELSDAEKKFMANLDEATRNFVLIQSMNEQRHKRTAMRIMLEHKHMFFMPNFDELEDDKREAVVAAALPYAQLFWLFCVSLCRELFEGEHILSPRDCQLLGLVDEVMGGGQVESRREYREKREKEDRQGGGAKGS